MTTIKKILFFSILFFSLMGYSQSNKMDSSKSITKIENLTKNSNKSSYTKTIKGKEYPVYKGTRGGFYIITYRKKDGAPYKRYYKKDELDQFKAKK